MDKKPIKFYLFQEKSILLPTNDEITNPSDPSSQ